MNPASRVAAAAMAVVLLAAVARAQIVAQARLDPPRVRVGDQADLAIEISGTQNASAPAVPAPDGVTLRYVGPATEISIVNGRTRSSITHHFAVTARREGTFTLGPITVQAEGRTLQAGAVTLQVSGSGAAGVQGAPADQQLRLELTAPKTRVHLHERVPFTITLLVGAARVTNVQFPQVPGNGFAVEPFGEPVQRQETRDGVAYQVVEFRGALTPARAGALTVGPATMGMAIVERSRQGHGFFFGGGQPRPITLESAPLALDVLPLPEVGRPADFSGAVGRFTLDVRAAPLELAAGDPVTLTYTVRGQGDLSSAKPPALAGGEALRVYPVQSAAAPQGSPPGIKVFEQVAIPERAGTITLPPVRFSWFDPEAEAYRTAEGAPIVLAVRGAAPGSGGQIVGAPVGTGTPAPETLGRDIVFIKDSPGTLAVTGAPRWRRPAFWLGQAVPLLAVLAVVAHVRRRRRLGADTHYGRATRAARTAREMLGRARQALERGDATTFHDTVASAMTGYLTAKLDLPPGVVTAAEIGPRLRAARAPEPLAAEAGALLAACEQARFAPAAAGDGDLRRTLARAEALVHSLERTRGLARMATAAALALLVVAAGAGAGEVESPAAGFFRANALYADGRYAEAAATYERVLASGVASANAFFNLGNARLKAGQPGPAILAYEQALRLAPGDPDIRANLSFARDQAGVPAPTRRVPLAGSWTTDALLLGAAAAWWLLAALLIVRLLLPAAGRPATAAALLAGTGLALLGTAAAYRLATVDLRRVAVVTAPADVAVRFEPSADGTVHYQAKPGTTLRVLGEREGWFQVRRADGLRGWVERTAVGEVGVPG